MSDIDGAVDFAEYLRSYIRRNYNVTRLNASELSAVIDRALDEWMSQREQSPSDWTWIW